MTLLLYLTNLSNISYWIIPSLIFLLADLAACLSSLFVQGINTQLLARLINNASSSSYSPSLVTIIPLTLNSSQTCKLPWHLPFCKRPLPYPTIGSVLFLVSDGYRFAPASLQQHTQCCMSTIPLSRPTKTRSMAFPSGIALAQLIPP